ncbi:MAG: aminotransferase class I/II-fold pyridoxal phosphate-dependent enzyme [Acidobacteria bacterium]|nr:aminotransferase class I/II-fold pyridoxal phosphate-dependent enzyme [Acidobacteriota bacterium]
MANNHKPKNIHTPDIHLNLNVRGLSRSATLAVNELSNDLLRDGRPIYKMGLGQSPFPVPEPVVEELRAHAHQKDYLPVMGLPALQRAVADYYMRRQGVSFSPASIMIGPGSKELMFLLQLVFYGDLVIPTPSWVSYAPQAHIIGRHIQWVSTSAEDGWRITPEQLHDLCRRDPGRPRLVILNYPANPHGGTYVLEELKELARVARRYRVLLLSDEIYGELHFNGQHVSIARFYPEGTIISGGLSKWCGAGGWRLGTFAFPALLDWLREAMAAVASETYTSVSAPIQFAAVRAFLGGPRIERYLTQARRVLRTLGRELHRRLIVFGVPVAEPRGAFYLFPDFANFRDELARRGIRTSEDLCTRLLEETGVAVLPGMAFGRPPEELTVRMAFVNFDGACALAKAEEVPKDKPLPRSFLENCCLNCLEGVERIGSWLRG